MARSVLVVSTVEKADAAIARLLGPDVEHVKVVVPVVRQGVLRWLTTDQKAYDRAREQAERTAERLPVDDAEPAVGEADVELAIQDALATFPADEVVVAVRAGDEAGAVERAATGELRDAVAGLPVRTIVVDDP
jgi:hypothetical protein